MLDMFVSGFVAVAEPQSLVWSGFAMLLIYISAALMRVGFSFCPSALGNRMEQWEKNPCEINVFVNIYMDTRIIY